MLNRVEHIDRVEGVSFDGINKIDMIGANIANPHIGTNLRKSICGDWCGFVDGNLNVANVKMLPIPNTNFQLGCETGRAVCPHTAEDADCGALRTTRPTNCANFQLDAGNNSTMATLEKDLHVSTRSARLKQIL